MTKKTKKSKEPKGRAGRRTVLTSDLVTRIAERIAGSFYLKYTIEGLGYTERVLYKWLRRGEVEVKRMEDRELVKAQSREAIYVQLVKAVRKAQSDSIAKHAINIQRNALGQPAQYLTDASGAVVRDPSGHPILTQPALPPNWQASARYLEAVDPEKWGRKIRADLALPEGGPSELRITVVKKREVKPLNLAGT